MRMLTVTCGHNSVLGGFHFEFSEGGRWGRVRYQCCKAGGAPVTFDPRGQLSQLVSPFDGTYCPTARDASGRPQYGSSNEQTLTFDRDAWKWCIGSHCSADTDVASPLGLVTKTWEVVNVSDFNGEFEGQMPKEGTKGMSLQDALKMKPPKRPKAPPMPELQDMPWEWILKCHGLCSTGVYLEVQSTAFKAFGVTRYTSIPRSSRRNSPNMLQSA